MKTHGSLRFSVSLLWMVALFLLVGPIGCDSKTEQVEQEDTQAENLRQEVEVFGGREQAGAFSDTLQYRGYSGESEGVEVFEANADANDQDIYLPKSVSGLSLLVRDRTTTDRVMYDGAISAPTNSNPIVVDQPGDIFPGTVKITFQNNITQDNWNGWIKLKNEDGSVKRTVNMKLHTYTKLSINAPNDTVVLSSTDTSPPLLDFTITGFATATNNPERQTIVWIKEGSDDGCGVVIPGSPSSNSRQVQYVPIDSHDVGAKTCVVAVQPQIFKDRGLNTARVEHQFTFNVYEPISLQTESINIVAPGSKVISLVQTSGTYGPAQGTATRTSADTNFTLIHSSATNLRVTAAYGTPLGSHVVTYTVNDTEGHVSEPGIVNVYIQRTFTVNSNSVSDVRFGDNVVAAGTAEANQTFDILISPFTVRTPVTADNLGNWEISIPTVGGAYSFVPGSSYGIVATASETNMDYQPSGSTAPVSFEVYDPLVLTTPATPLSAGQGTSVTWELSRASGTYDIPTTGAEQTYITQLSGQDNLTLTRIGKDLSVAVKATAPPGIQSATFTIPDTDGNDSEVATIQVNVLEDLGNRYLYTETGLAGPFTAPIAELINTLVGFTADPTTLNAWIEYSGDTSTVSTSIYGIDYYPSVDKRAHWAGSTITYEVCEDATRVLCATGIVSTKTLDRIKITSPAAGSYITNTAPTIEGTSDAWSSSVTVRAYNPGPTGTQMMSQSVNGITTQNPEWIVNEGGQNDFGYGEIFVRAFNNNKLDGELTFYIVRPVGFDGLTSDGTQANPEVFDSLQPTIRLKGEPGSTVDLTVYNDGTGVSVAFTDSFDFVTETYDWTPSVNLPENMVFKIEAVGQANTAELYAMAYDPVEASIDTRDINSGGPVGNYYFAEATGGANPNEYDVWTGTNKSPYHTTIPFITNKPLSNIDIQLTNKSGDFDLEWPQGLSYIKITPNTNDNAQTYSFDAILSETSIPSNSITLTIHVTYNDAPTFTNISPTGTPIVYTDQANGEISFEIDTGDIYGGHPTAEFVYNGQVSDDNCVDTDLNSSTRKVIYQAVNATAGAKHCYVKICEPKPEGVCTTRDFVFQVSDPVVASLTPKDDPEYYAANHVGDAGDPHQIWTIANGNQGSLTIPLTVNKDAADVKINVTNLTGAGGNVSRNGFQNELLFTKTDAYAAGEYTFDVTVCDVVDNSNCDSFSVRLIYNDPPNVVSDTFYVDNTAGSVEEMIVADNGGAFGTLVYPTLFTENTGARCSLTSENKGVTFSKYNASGIYTCKFSVCDKYPRDNCETGTFTFIAQPPLNAQLVPKDEDTPFPLYVSPSGSTREVWVPVGTTSVPIELTSGVQSIEYLSNGQGHPNEPNGREISWAPPNPNGASVYVVSVRAYSEPNYQGLTTDVTFSVIYNDRPEINANGGTSTWVADNTVGEINFDLTGRGRGVLVDQNNPPQALPIVNGTGCDVVHMTGNTYKVTRDFLQFPFPSSNPETCTVSACEEHPGTDGFCSSTAETFTFKPYSGITASLDLTDNSGDQYAMNFGDSMSQPHEVWVPVQNNPVVIPMESNYMPDGSTSWDVTFSNYNVGVGTPDYPDDTKAEIVYTPNVSVTAGERDFTVEICQATNPQNCIANNIKIIYNDAPVITGATTAEFASSESDKSIPFGVNMGGYGTAPANGDYRTLTASSDSECELDANFEKVVLDTSSPGSYNCSLVVCEQWPTNVCSSEADYQFTIYDPITMALDTRDVANGGKVGDDYYATNTGGISNDEHQVWVKAGETAIEIPLTSNFAANEIDIEIVPSTLLGGDTGDRVPNSNAISFVPGVPTTAGTRTFDVKACESGSAVNCITMTVAVTLNDPPVLTLNPSTTSSNALAAESNDNDVYAVATFAYGDVDGVLDPNTFVITNRDNDGGSCYATYDGTAGEYRVGLDPTKVSMSGTMATAQCEVEVCEQKPGATCDSQVLYVEVYDTMVVHLVDNGSTYPRQKIELSGSDRIVYAPVNTGSIVEPDIVLELEGTQPVKSVQAKSGTVPNGITVTPTTDGATVTVTVGDRSTAGSYTFTLIGYSDTDYDGFSDEIEVTVNVIAPPSITNMVSLEWNGLVGEPIDFAMFDLSTTPAMNRPYTNPTVTPSSCYVVNSGEIALILRDTPGSSGQKQCEVTVCLDDFDDVCVTATSPSYTAHALWVFNDANVDGGAAQLAGSQFTVDFSTPPFLQSSGSNAMDWASLEGTWSDSNAITLIGQDNNGSHTYEIVATATGNYTLPYRFTDQQGYISDWKTLTLTVQAQQNATINSVAAVTQDFMPTQPWLSGTGQANTNATVEIRTQGTSNVLKSIPVTIGNDGNWESAAFSSNTDNLSAGNYDVVVIGANNVPSSPETLIVYEPPTLIGDDVWVEVGTASVAIDVDDYFNIGLQNGGGPISAIGQPISPVHQSGPGSGAFSVTGSGTISYTPASGALNLPVHYKFNVRALDQGTGEATAEFELYYNDRPRVNGGEENAEVSGAVVTLPVVVDNGADNNTSLGTVGAPTLTDNQNGRCALNPTGDTISFTPDATTGVFTCIVRVCETEMTDFCTDGEFQFNVVEGFSAKVETRDEEGLWASGEFDGANEVWVPVGTSSVSFDLEPSRGALSQDTILVTPPANIDGNVGISSDGVTITFTPSNQDSVKDYSFTVEACESLGFPCVEVDIRVVYNDPPQLTTTGEHGDVWEVARGDSGTLTFTANTQSFGTISETESSAQPPASVDYTCSMTVDPISGEGTVSIDTQAMNAIDSAATCTVEVCEEWPGSVCGNHVFTWDVYDRPAFDDTTVTVVAGSYEEVDLATLKTAGNYDVDYAEIALLPANGNVDGGEVVVTRLSGADEGKLRIEIPDNSYAPSASPTFQFRVPDEKGHDSAWATVTVNVITQDSVTIADSAYRVTENFMEPDDLVITGTAEPGADVALEIQAGSYSVSDSVTATGGIWSWKPFDTDSSRPTSGEYTAAITATGENNVSVTANLIVYDPPKLADDVTWLSVGTSMSNFNISGLYNLGVGHGGALTAIEEPITVTPTYDNNHSATVSVIDHQSYDFEATDPDAPETYEFDLTVRDAGTGEATGHFTVHMNDLPVIAFEKDDADVERTSKYVILGESQTVEFTTSPGVLGVLSGDASLVSGGCLLDRTDSGAGNVPGEYALSVTTNATDPGTPIVCEVKQCELQPGDTCTTRAFTFEPVTKFQVAVQENATNPDGYVTRQGGETNDQHEVWLSAINESGVSVTIESLVPGTTVGSVTVDDVRKQGDTQPTTDLDVSDNSNGAAIQIVPISNVGDIYEVDIYACSDVADADNCADYTFVVHAVGEPTVVADPDTSIVTTTAKTSETITLKVSDEARAVVTTTEPKCGTPTRGSESGGVVSWSVTINPSALGEDVVTCPMTIQAPHPTNAPSETVTLSFDIQTPTEPVVIDVDTSSQFAEYVNQSNDVWAYTGATSLFIPIKDTQDRDIHDILVTNGDNTAWTITAYIPTGDASDPYPEAGIVIDDVGNIAGDWTVALDVCNDAYCLTLFEGMEIHVHVVEEPQVVDTVETTPNAWEKWVASGATSASYAYAVTPSTTDFRYANTSADARCGIDTTGTNPMVTLEDGTGLGANATCTVDVQLESPQNANIFGKMPVTVHFVVSTGLQVQLVEVDDDPTVYAVVDSVDQDYWQYTTTQPSGISISLEHVGSAVDFEVTNVSLESTAPSGASMDPDEGTNLWFVSSGEEGSYDATVTVVELNNPENTATFVFTIHIVAPTELEPVADDSWAMTTTTAINPTVFEVEATPQDDVDVVVVAAESTGTCTPVKGQNGIWEIRLATPQSEGQVTCTIQAYQTNTEDASVFGREKRTITFDVQEVLTPRVADTASPQNPTTEYDILTGDNHVWTTQSATQVFVPVIDNNYALSHLKSWVTTPDQGWSTGDVAGTTMDGQWGLLINNVGSVARTFEIETEVCVDSTLANCASLGLTVHVNDAPIVPGVDADVERKNSGGTFASGISVGDVDGGLSVESDNTACDTSDPSNIAVTLAGTEMLGDTITCDLKACEAKPQGLCASEVEHTFRVVGPPVVEPIELVVAQGSSGESFVIDGNTTTDFDDATFAYDELLLPTGVSIGTPSNHSVHVQVGEDYDGGATFSFTFTIADADTSIVDRVSDDILVTVTVIGQPTIDDADIWVADGDFQATSTIMGRFQSGMVNSVVSNETVGIAASIVNDDEILITPGFYISNTVGDAQVTVESCTPEVNPLDPRACIIKTIQVTVNDAPWLDAASTTTDIVLGDIGEIPFTVNAGQIDDLGAHEPEVAQGSDARCSLNAAKDAILLTTAIGQPEAEDVECIVEICEERPAGLCGTQIFTFNLTEGLVAHVAPANESDYWAAVATAPNAPDEVWVEDTVSPVPIPLEVSKDATINVITGVVAASKSGTDWTLMLTPTIDALTDTIVLNICEDGFGTSNCVELEILVTYVAKPNADLANPEHRIEIQHETIVHYIQPGNSNGTLSMPTASSSDTSIATCQSDATSLTITPEPAAKLGDTVDCSVKACEEKPNGVCDTFVYTFTFIGAPQVNPHEFWAPQDDGVVTNDSIVIQAQGADLDYGSAVVNAPAGVTALINAVTHTLDVTVSDTVTASTLQFDYDIQDLDGYSVTVPVTLHVVLKPTIDTTEEWIVEGVDTVLSNRLPSTTDVDNITVVNSVDGTTGVSASVESNHVDLKVMPGTFVGDSGGVTIKSCASKDSLQACRQDTIPVVVNDLPTFADDGFGVAQSGEQEVNVQALGYADPRTIGVIDYGSLTLDMDNSTQNEGTCNVTNGVLTYKANADATFDVVDACAVTICEEQPAGACASAVFTFTIQDLFDPKPDTILGVAGQPTFVTKAELMANDGNVDPDFFEIMAGTGLNVTIDGDTIQITPNGNVTSASEVLFTYKVRSGFIGDASIEDIVTVTVDIVDPPTGDYDEVWALENGVANVPSPFESDSDGRVYDIIVTPETSVTNIASIVESDGSIMVTPEPDFVGFAIIPVTACTDTTPSACVERNLTVVFNDLPTIANASRTISYVGPQDIMIKELYVAGGLASAYADVGDQGAWATPTSVTVLDEQGNPQSSVTTQNGTCAVVGVDPDEVVRFTPSGAGAIDTTTICRVRVCEARPDDACAEADLTFDVKDSFHPTNDEIIGVRGATTEVTVETLLSNDGTTNGDFAIVANSVEGGIAQVVNGVVEFATKSDADTAEFKYTIGTTINGIPGIAEVTVTVNILDNPPIVADGMWMIQNTTATMVSPFDTTQGFINTITQPANGQVVEAADGTWSVTPTPGFVGIMQVGVESCTNTTPAACGTASIPITVNDLPTVSSTQSRVGIGIGYAQDVIAGANHGIVGAIDENSLALVDANDQPIGSTTMTTAHGTCAVNGRELTFTANNDAGYIDAGYIDTCRVRVCELQPVGACTSQNFAFEIMDSFHPQDDPRVDSPYADKFVAVSGEQTTLERYFLLENDGSTNESTFTLVAGSAVGGTAVIQNGGNNAVIFTTAPGVGATDEVSFEYRVCSSLSGQSNLCKTAKVVLSVPEPPLLEPQDTWVLINEVTILPSPFVNGYNSSLNNQIEALPNANNEIIAEVLLNLSTGEFKIEPIQDYIGEVIVHIRSCTPTTPAACAEADMIVTVNDLPIVNPPAAVPVARGAMRYIDIMTGDFSDTNNIASYGQYGSFDDNNGDLSVKTQPPSSQGVCAINGGRVEFTAAGDEANVGTTASCVVTICEDLPQAPQKACTDGTFTFAIVDSFYPTNDILATTQGLAIPVSLRTAENDGLLDNDGNAKDATFAWLGVPSTDVPDAFVTDEGGLVEVDSNDPSGFVYTPDPAFIGEDAIVYEICSAVPGDESDCRPATVTIVVNEGPSILDETQWVIVGTPSVSMVLQDVGGQISSFDVVSIGGDAEFAGLTAQANISTVPQQGANDEATIHITPDDVSVPGVYVAIIEVCNFMAECSQASATAIYNDHPVVADPDVVINPGTSRHFDFARITLESHTGVIDGGWDEDSLMVASTEAGPFAAHATLADANACEINVDGDVVYTMSATVAYGDKAPTCYMRVCEANPGVATPFANRACSVIDMTPFASDPVVITEVQQQDFTDLLPTIVGTSAPETTIDVVLDGPITIHDQITSTETGTWSWTPSVELDYGDYTFTVTAENGSNDSVEIQTRETSVVGPEPGDDDPTPTISGKGRPNSTITIIIDGREIDTVIVDENGNWSWTPDGPMEPGTYTIFIRGANGELTPIEVVIRGVGGNVTGPFNKVSIVRPVNGATTAQTRPGMFGVGQPDSSAHIYLDYVQSDVLTIDPDGNWKWKSHKPLQIGSHRISVYGEDGSFDTIELNVESAGIFSGDVTVKNPKNEAMIADLSVLFSGTAGPNTTVIIYLDDRVVGTAKADPAGNWYFSPSSLLSEGKHDVTVVGENGSVASTSFVTYEDYVSGGFTGCSASSTQHSPTRHASLLAFVSLLGLLWMRRKRRQG